MFTTTQIVIIIGVCLVLLLLFLKFRSPPTSNPTFAPTTTPYTTTTPAKIWNIQGVLIKKSTGQIVTPSIDYSDSINLYNLRMEPKSFFDKSKDKYSKYSNYYINKQSIDTNTGEITGYITNNNKDFYIIKDPYSDKENLILSRCAKNDKSNPNCDIDKNGIFVFKNNGQVLHKDTNKIIYDKPGYGLKLSGSTDTADADYDINNTIFAIVSPP